MQDQPPARNLPHFTIQSHWFTFSMAVLFLSREYKGAF